MPPDSSAIDEAIVQALRADTLLTSYMPDGVWVDEAPANSKRFVIVSLVEEVDPQGFDGRAMEDAVYLIKAVGLKSTNPNMRGAAVRIDTALNDQPLSVSGYQSMVIFRENRIRTTEIDDIDNTIRWYHRGGRYRVVIST